VRAAQIPTDAAIHARAPRVARVSTQNSRSNFSQRTFAPHVNARTFLERTPHSPVHSSDARRAVRETYALQRRTLPRSDGNDVITFTPHVRALALVLGSFGADRRRREASDFPRELDELHVPSKLYDVEWIILDDEPVIKEQIVVRKFTVALLNRFPRGDVSRRHEFDVAVAPVDHSNSRGRRKRMVAHINHGKHRRRGRRSSHFKRPTTRARAGPAEGVGVDLHLHAASLRVLTIDVIGSVVHDERASGELH